MKASKLIELLKDAIDRHGDIPVHLSSGGIESSPMEIRFVAEGQSVVIGQVTGPHLHEPARLVITATGLW